MLSQFAGQELIIFGAQDFGSGLVMRDVSQALGRHRDSFDFIVGTLLPGSKFWNYDAARFLTGFDHLNLQGFPWASLSSAVKYSSSQLADLAGNGFAAPCSLAIDMAILVSALRMQHAAGQQPQPPACPELRCLNLRSLFAAESDAEE